MEVVHQQSQIRQHCPIPQDLAYGLVYEISPSDEASLDQSEGVPRAYTKELMGIELWLAKNGKEVVAQCLVYIDESVRDTR